MRGSTFPCKENYWGYTHRTGLSFSSKTAGAGKASADSWIQSRVHLSGQYQSGGKRRIFLAEREYSGIEADLNDTA